MARDWKWYVSEAKRFLRGDFWFPCRVPKYHQGVTFRGLPGRKTKSGDSRCDMWVLLRVDAPQYKVYFMSAGKSVRHFRRHRSQYVALRIGPHDVTFYAPTKVEGMVVNSLHVECFPTTWALVIQYCNRNGIKMGDITWI